MSRAALILAALALLSSCAGCVTRAGLERVTEASALSCARASDGTDTSIADCYTARGLPLPERI